VLYPRRLGAPRDGGGQDNQRRVMHPFPRQLSTAIPKQPIPSPGRAEGKRISYRLRPDPRAPGKFDLPEGSPTFVTHYRLDACRRVLAFRLVTGNAHSPVRHDHHPPLSALSRGLLRWGTPLRAMLPLYSFGKGKFRLNHPNPRCFGCVFCGICYGHVPRRGMQALPGTASGLRPYF
jgi:hypothetical protein